MIEELLLESICVPLLLRSGIKKYIAGIDLYSSKEAYAFDTFKKNLLTIMPRFKDTPSKCHTKEIDI